jgi:uncharacterized membrane protein YqjE
MLESLSLLATTLVSIAHTRLDLLSTDLDEDREHLASLILLGLGALFCLGVGVILSTILLVVVFWDTHRLLLLTTLALIFLAAGVATAVYAQRKAKARPRLFVSSLEELFKDRQQLLSRS